MTILLEKTKTVEQQKTIKEQNTPRFEHNHETGNNQFVGYNENEDENDLSQSQQIMLNDFLTTFVHVKQDEEEKKKQYDKVLNWIDFKTYFLSLNKTTFLGVTLLLTGLLFPGLFLFGLIGMIMVFNTLFNETSKRNILFKKNLAELRAHEMSLIPPPNLLSNWLSSFSKKRLNQEEIEVITDLVAYIPDHPLIIGLAKAYKAQKYGIDIQYQQYDIALMLNDGINSLRQLKSIQTIRNNIKKIKERNPHLGLPDLPEHPVLSTYLNHSKEDEFIELKYEEIKQTHDFFYRYFITIQNIGMKALDIV